MNRDRYWSLSQRRVVRQATETFVDALTDALRTVGQANVRPEQGYDLAQRPFELNINFGQRMRLGGDPPVFLASRIDVLAEQLGARSMRLRTTGYVHELENRQDQRILAFHWHPTGVSPYRTPHLQIGIGAGKLEFNLTDAHIETGIIALQDVLGLAIGHFGVPPRLATWRDMLARTRERVLE